MERKIYPVGPDRPHSVYRYTDQIYKIVQFYDVRQHLGPGPRDQQEHHDKKLDNSLSRTRRVILEKALCNSWEWFCTFTISEERMDRKNLSAWRDGFTQWIRDLRKKGFCLQYLLVPEQHKDGSWHAHGFFSGLPETELISFKEMDKRGYRTAKGRRLPKKLRYSSYMNWPAYQEKFGFCSFGRIKEPIAAGFYITKYITKENDRMVSEVGLHSYYASRGLQSATKHVDFFGRDPAIERLLVNEYEFCRTGMTHVKNQCDWTFCMDYVDPRDMEPLDLGYNSDNEKSAPEMEADSYYNFEQLVLKM